MTKLPSKILIQSTILAMTLFSSAYAKSVPSISWTGFYGGVNSGFVFNDVKLRSQQLGFTDPSNTCNHHEDLSSFFPGLQVGYSSLIDDNNIVLGLEGNVSINTQQSKTLECDCSLGTTVWDFFRFKNHMQTSLIGRVGYPLIVNNMSLLPFVTAGASFADLGLTYENEAGDYYSTNNFKAGWRVGAGVDWAIYRNWSVRAEYFYADYGKALQMNIPMLYGLTDPNGKGHVNLSTNTIQFALNYWI